MRPLNSLWQLSVPRRSLINCRRCSDYQPRASYTSKASSADSAHSASAKLFADAQREEAESEQYVEANSKSSQLPFLERQHENWTGDESIQDSVLRMLVDKYKPLRTGSIQSADQKLKRAPPQVSLTNTIALVPLKPSTGSWANEPLLPSIPGHQPWQTQFKAPSHHLSSIKLAHIPPPISARPPSALPIDERARKLEKENQKRTQQAGRLTRAKESTLDYRLGIKEARGPIRRPNPVSVKGWAALIEDKIEKARKAGLFNSIKGRGQPLVQSMDERNPFITREEFLMNRIVQRNGAAPPWVEVQGELDSALSTFRELLRQSWIRRAIRCLSMEHPADILHNLTLNDIKVFRDPEWVKREKAYHETAIAELNSHVRKYNGVAPYAVRRAYYTREMEIQRLYDDDCAKDILRAIAERAQEPGFLGGSTSQGPGRGPIIGSRAAHTDPGEKLSFLHWLRSLFRSWFS
ncbi:hypothetical protein BYT27DRAFT_7212436 [Phlegmacium glaucopus]|nr:hypothetical protein BYT27DRAFT_7212436 [Phlegmacium glaucopus]